MKKLFALFLALTLALSLAACSEKDNGSGTLSQSGNNTNKSKIWTDSDKHTVTLRWDTKNNDNGINDELEAPVEAVVTIWNPKLITSKDVHPASSKYSISITEGMVDFWYIPYVVTIKNVSDVAVTTSGLKFHSVNNLDVLFYSVKDGLGNELSPEDPKESVSYGISLQESGYEATYVGYAAISDLDFPLYDNSTIISFDRRALFGYDPENKNENENPNIWLLTSTADGSKQDGWHIGDSKNWVDIYSGWLEK